jgi:hypothetical protein
MEELHDEASRIKLPQNHKHDRPIPSYPQQDRKIPSFTEVEKQMEEIEKKKAHEHAKIEPEQVSGLKCSDEKEEKGDEPHA